MFMDKEALVTVLDFYMFDVKGVEPWGWDGEAFYFNAANEAEYSPRTERKNPAEAGLC